MCDEVLMPESVKRLAVWNADGERFPLIIDPPSNVSGGTTRPMPKEPDHGYVQKLREEASKMSMDTSVDHNEAEEPEQPEQPQPEPRADEERRRSRFTRFKSFMCLSGAAASKPDFGCIEYRASQASQADENEQREWNFHRKKNSWSVEMALHFQT